MFIGKVIGTVWSTVKWPELTGHKLLLVRPYHLAELRAALGRKTGTDASPASQRETVVCVDLLDAGVGDDVVVAFGHAARVAVADALNAASGTGAAAPASLPKTFTPIDAAVVAVVDNYALADAV